MFSRLKHLFSRAFDELCKELAYTRSSRRPHRLIFDHIPKCAGSALGAFLKLHYPDRKVFTTKGSGPLESVEQFRQLPEAKRHSFELLKGHFTGHLIDCAHPDCLVVTVLREPVDRIVSHYYFAKEKPTHYLHEQIHSDNLSLKDYVESGISHELQNHYTLHFSGFSVEDAERDPEGAITKAYECLRGYDLVGFQDELPAFVGKLSQLVGLRFPFPEKKVNVTQVRKNVREIDDVALEAIEKANALDLELYRRIRSK